MKAADAQSQGGLGPFRVFIDFGLEKVGPFLPAFETFHASDGLHKKIRTGGDEFQETTESVEGLFVFFEGEMEVGEGFEFAGGNGRRGFAGQAGGDEAFLRFAAALERHFDNLGSAGSVGHD
jgi:hypothetical protein